MQVQATDFLFQKLSNAIIDYGPISFSILHTLRHISLDTTPNLCNAAFKCIAIGCPRTSCVGSDQKDVERVSRLQLCPATNLLNWYLLGHRRYIGMSPDHHQDSKNPINKNTAWAVNTV